jgi:hypothetical protein
MRLLIPILLLALTIGTLLLLGSKDDTVLSDPVPRGAAPRVASVSQDPASPLPAKAIPVARFEAPASSDRVVPVEHPALLVEAAVASKKPPVLSGVVVGPDGQRVTDPLRVLFLESSPDTPEILIPSASAMTQDGAFAFDALPAKEGQLGIGMPNPRIQANWLQTRIVAAREGDHGLIISVIKAGNVSGRVDLADSGFPHDTLRVRLRHRNAEAWHDTLPVLFQDVALPLDGSFGFGLVPPGFVDVEVLLLPFREVLAEVLSVDVRPGKDSDDQRLDPIQLPLARRADLRVVDRAGFPIHEFTVLADGQVIERRFLIRGDDWPSLFEGLRLARHGNIVLSHEQGLGHGFVFDSRHPDPDAGPAHLPGAAGSPVSILLGTKPQTLRILAPGYLLATHELTGDAVVELSAAPDLQVTLDSKLIGPMGGATKTTFLTLNLEPEGTQDIPVSSVMLQGTLGFDTTTRTFAVPTLGPGRYRLRATLITNRGGFG